MRFGRGVTYADLETYFVVNDAHDLEYLGEEDMVKYYPRYSSKRIDETSSIQGGEPWGGLGIRVETRGFQWNNPQARDAIFGSIIFLIHLNTIYQRSALVIG